jgi:hypothetical protein
VNFTGPTFNPATQNIIPNANPNYYFIPGINGAFMNFVPNNGFVPNNFAQPFGLYNNPVIPNYSTGKMNPKNNLNGSMGNLAESNGPHLNINPLHKINYDTGVDNPSSRPDANVITPIPQISLVYPSYANTAMAQTERPERQNRKNGPGNSKPNTTPVKNPVNGAAAKKRNAYLANATKSGASHV